MKKLGGTICIIILLFAGLSISPAIGSIIEAIDNQEDQNVTIYFWDCTGIRPIKQIIELPETKWQELKEKLKETKKTSITFEESFNAQCDLFNQYGFITGDVNYESLNKIAIERFENKIIRQPKNPALDNVIVNAICAITFVLDSCNTFVFGLNTFMNLVGLNIISFHKGNTTGEISTFGGLLVQTAGPGEFVGFMFGFLGYWAGTKTGTGTYSDLSVAGFTVITSWFPISSK